MWHQWRCMIVLVFTSFPVPKFIQQLDVQNSSPLVDWLMLFTKCFPCFKFLELSDYRNNVSNFLHPSEGLIQLTQTMRLYVLLTDWGEIITIAHLLFLLKFTLQSFIETFANDFENELTESNAFILLKSQKNRFNSCGIKLRPVFN